MHCNELFESHSDEKEADLRDIRDDYGVVMLDCMVVVLLRITTGPKLLLRWQFQR